MPQWTYLYLHGCLRRKLSFTQMLSPDGTWKRRASRVVHGADYGKLRAEQWCKYEVPADAETHPRPQNNMILALPDVMPETGRLEEAQWVVHTWDEAMDEQRCHEGARAVDRAFGGLASQRVGADQVAWTNPLSRGNFERSDLTGDVYVKGTAPRAAPPSDDAIMEDLRNTPGGVRVFGGAPPVSHLAPGPPPRMIAAADLMRWKPLPNSFPVYVAYPGFGPGLAMRALVYRTTAGWGTGGLFYAVKKFTPLGPVPREPFALGVFGVPALWVTRMTVAVAQLFPAENIAVMDDFRGDQYSIPFLTLRSTKDPRYEIARRALLVQYPYLLSDLFATRLRAQPPPDMKPGGAVAPGFTDNQAVLVAPPASGDQAPQDAQ